MSRPSRISVFRHHHFGNTAETPSSELASLNGETLDSFPDRPHSPSGFNNQPRKFLFHHTKVQGALFDGRARQISSHAFHPSSKPGLKLKLWEHPTNS